MAVSCFSKCSIVDVWQGFEYAYGSEYPRILNMSLVLNVPEFWIYQGSEYASGFEYARILSIPEFGICQGYTGFRICLNNSWICLIMSGYIWLCLNMPKYVWICLNLPEWLLFYSSPVDTLHNTWLLIWTSTGD